jgi:hypothetical protein
MATERQRQIALGVVLVVLAFVLYRAVTSLRTSSAPAGTTSSGPASSSNGRQRAGRSGRGAEAPATAPDVHLRALDDERPKPVSGDRNLFRFKPKPAPPPPPAPPAPPPVVRTTPIGPVGPPPLPPIPLRFIGIVEAPTQPRVAALVDSTGHSLQGREGEVVAGQYRILKIGMESIEMAYLDGRGRQTIRLSGS